ncbi:MAG: hypothetical protein PHW02_03640 [bacterium]|nr:hypothetical protein [bacterium]
MTENKDCITVIKKLCGYIDREESEVCCREIEKHLRECDSCRNEYDKMKEMFMLCKSSRENLSPEELSALKKNIFKLIEKE